MLDDAYIINGKFLKIVSLICKELRKNLSTYKVPSFFLTLNIIAIQQEYVFITDVGCNCSMLSDFLVDGKADFNVMIIPQMRYIGLEIERALFFLENGQ